MKFTAYDTGLGTSYERISLYGLLEKLAAELNIQSSLEGPIDGITGVNGINSIALARRGVSCTVVLPHEELIRYARRFYQAEGCLESARFVCAQNLALREKFDLVWNFNGLPQIPDPTTVLREMANRSRRFLLLFVSNTWNYGFWIHRLHHCVERQPWDHGSIAVMNTRRLAAELSQLGYRIRRKLFVDVPWWPDIDSPIEEVASSFFPFLQRFLKRSRRLEIYKYDDRNFPYFDAGRRAELMGVLNRHPNFEHSRIPFLRGLFGHHRGLLAEKIA